MGLRRVSVGSVDILVVAPPGVGRRLRTLGGLLEKRGIDDRPGAPPPVALPSPAALASEGARALQERVNAIEWYHTIDLGDGVVTPGWFDLRKASAEYPIPARLDGMRVLDVATFDGFWAFEFERRGAAEVVALDIDSFAEVDICPRLRRGMDPAYLARKTGEGFRLAREARKSRVERVVCNVYDLSPERLGQFDFVFISDVLLHLRNPMKALDNVCSVTRGRSLIVDVYNPRLPGMLMNYLGGENHNTWWEISFGALEQMIRDAGFAQVELKRRIPLGYSANAPVLWQAAFEAQP